MFETLQFYMKKLHRYRLAHFNETMIRRGWSIIMIKYQLKR